MVRDVDHGPGEASNPTMTRRWAGPGSIAVIAGAILVAACVRVMPEGVDVSEDGGDGIERVTGNLYWRERLVLRPGAVAEVSLIDVSRADAPARTIADQTIEDVSVPPVPFALEFDSASIDERMSYAVRAVIRHEGRLLFTTDTHNPVLTRGAGSTVDLMLKKVAGRDIKPDASLTNTYWKLVAIGNEVYRHDSANREPFLKYSASDNAVAGFTGCNRFTGGFETNGNMLRIGNLAVTQRACIEGMEVEAGFLKALGKANRYDIQGDTMQMLADDEVLLGFEAIYF
jgi:putative lipoprotein